MTDSPCPGCLCPLLSLACPCRNPGRRGYPVPAYGEQLAKDPTKWAPIILNEGLLDAGLTLAEAVERAGLTDVPPEITAALTPKPKGPEWARAFDCLEACPPGPRTGSVRVGFAGPAFSYGGGIETWHRTLLRHLDPSRVSVVGLATLDSQSSTWENLTPIRAFCPTGLGAESIKRLAAAVEVLVLWGIPDPAAYLPESGHRPRVVLTAHMDPSSGWTATVIGRSGGDVDRYVVLSEAGRQVFARSRAAVSVLPNAYDPERLKATKTRQEVRDEWNIAPSEVVVGFNARLALEKGPLTVIRALEFLPPQFRLVVSGSGVDANAVHAEAERFPGRVAFLGWREDLGDVLTGFDLAVNPSATEAFGISLSEFLAAGVPTLASPLGLAKEHPELVRVVGSQSPEAWAAAIQEDWRDEAGRAARVRRAQTFVAENYAAPAWAAKWADLLEGEAKIRRAMPAPVKPTRPGFFQQLANVTTAAIRHVANGAVNVPAEVQKRRIGLCEACEGFDAGARRCKACKCFLDAKTWMPLERCPLGKWEAETATAAPAAAPCGTCGKQTGAA